VTAVIDTLAFPAAPGAIKLNNRVFWRKLVPMHTMSFPLPAVSRAPDIPSFEIVSLGHASYSGLVAVVA
jgi:hypothetical protein